MGDDTHSLIDDIENIMQLSSLMKNVHIGGDSTDITRRDEGNKRYLP